MAKRLIPNEAFLENLTEEFVVEFAHTDEPLPILLIGLFEDYGFDIADKRMKFYETHPDLEKEDDRESEITLKLLDEGKKSEAQDFQVQCAVEFLNEHPQFKMMVNGVESPAAGIIRLISDTIRKAFLGDF